MTPRMHLADGHGEHTRIIDWGRENASRSVCIKKRLVAGTVQMSMAEAMRLIRKR